MFFKKIIHYFSKLSLWRYVIWITVLAFVLSEILMAIHRFLLGNSEIRDNPFVIETAIPMTEAFILAIITGLILQYTIRLYESRNEAIQEVDEAQTRYKALLDTTLEGFWIVNVDGILIDVNEAYAKMSAYTKEELIGQHISFVEALQSKEEISKNIQQLIQEGRTIFRSQHKRKDGSFFDVEISISYTTLENGMFFSLIHDISERNQYYTQIKNKTLLLETIIDSLPMRIFWKDLEGKFMGINKVLLQDTGFAKKEDVIGRTDHEMAWKEYADDYRADDFEVIESAQAKLNMIENVTKDDGSHLTVETSKVPLKNYQGEIIGILGIFTDITQQYQASKMLQEAKEEYETIFNSSMDGIAITDLESNFLEFNKAYELMIGYSREELLKQSCIGLSVPQDVAKSQAAVEHVLKHGSYSNFEKSCRKKDGNIILVSMSLALMPDKQRIILNVKDITQQKHIEQELKELNTKLEERVRERTKEFLIQKETLERLFENSSQGVLILENGFFVECNAKVIEILGCSSKEYILNKSPFELSPEIQPDGRSSKEKVLEMNAKAINEGYNRFEWEFTRCNGEHFPLEVTLVPIHLPGRENTIHVAWRDLTEVKRKEQALEESENLLRNIMESAVDGIVSINETGKIETFNKAAEDLFAYSRDELIGQNIKTLLPEPYASKQDQEIAEYLKEGMLKAIGQTAEIWAVKKDGTEFPASIRIGEVKLTNKRIFTALIQDITERKKYEQAIVQAKESAESAAKMKSEFLANMSHEIRTPMNAIMGMTHLVLETDLNERQRNYITKVYRSSEILLGIINDILDFSKIESNKLELENLPFMIDDVFNDLTSIISVKAKEKNIELSYEIEDDTPIRLVGDSLRLQQVLLNLLSNAVKFSNEYGNILVTLKKENETAEKVKLQFCVKDEGIGMTQEEASRLFKAFSQADTSTTRQYGGTGLGLVICKSIVELMNGSIWIESTKGKGSSFYFTVELEKHHAVDIVDERMDSLLGNLHVLLVEDSIYARRIIAHMLERFGFDIVEASDGKEALDKVRNADQRPFDLILSDIIMPNMGGIEMLEQLCEELEPSLYPHVILMSAKNTEGIKEKIKNLPVNRILSKPFTISDLHDTICDMRLRDAANLKKDTKSELALETIDLNGLSILLVEDNLFNQEVAVDLLSSYDISVQIANNGLEALDILKEEQFDVVLMDCQMPVMDGYEATKHIREDEKFKDLPVIAFTANALRTERDLIFASGMNDLVTKPIHPHELIQTIAKWTKRRWHPLEKGIHEKKDPHTKISLPEYKGLDLKQGLLSADQNEKTYVKMLYRFLDGQKDFKTQYEHSTKEGEIQDQIRLAHTLKGISGTIGAIQLQEASKELEYALKENASKQLIERFFGDVCKLLDDLLTNLQKWKEMQEEHKTDVQDSSPSSIDFQKVLHQLSLLKELVQEYDTQALDKLLELQEMHLTDKKEEIEKLQKLLSSLEFDTALPLIEELYNSIEKTNFSEIKD